MIKSCPITKIENPLRNILLPALIFALTSFISALLTYGIFMDKWHQFSHLFRPESENIWCLLIHITSLFYGVVLSVIYVKICKKTQKIISIYYYAFLVFLLSRFFGEIYSYLMIPYDFSFALIGLAHGFLSIYFWALISKRIFNFNLNKNVSISK